MCFRTLDTKNKETTLSEEAEIYSPHKDIPEKEKWSKMNSSEKLTHFKEYYAFPLIIAAMVIGIAVYLISDAVTNYRDIVFMATIINDDIDDDTLDEFNDSFLSYLGNDPKKDKSNICDGFIISGGSSSDAVSATESITSYIYAKQLDAMIADDATFNHYASLGCFLDLKDFLTEEEYAKYSEYIYYPELEENTTNVPGSDTDTIRPTETYPCGIRLGDSEVYKKMGGVQPDPIIGIVATSDRRENALSFLEYLFPEK